MISLLRLELALLVLRLRRLIMIKNLQFIRFDPIDDTPFFPFLHFIEPCFERDILSL